MLWLSVESMQGQEEAEKVKGVRLIDDECVCEGEWDTAAGSAGGGGRDGCEQSLTGVAV